MALGVNHAILCGFAAAILNFILYLDPITMMLGLLITAEEASPAFERTVIGARTSFFAGFRIFDFLTKMRSLQAQEIEAQTALDTTTGPREPMGQRGAAKSDSLGESRAT